MAPLNLALLITGVVIMALLLLWFLRKPSNAHPEQYRQPDGSGGNKVDPNVEGGLGDPLHTQKR